MKIIGFLVIEGWQPPKVRGDLIVFGKKWMLAQLKGCEDIKQELMYNVIPEEPEAFGD